MSYVLSTIMAQPIPRPPYGRLSGLRGVAEDAAAFVAQPFTFKVGLEAPEVGGARQVKDRDTTGRVYLMVMPGDGVSYSAECLANANALAVQSAAEGIMLTHADIARIAIACQAERRGEKPVGFTQAVIDLLAVRTEAWYRDPMYLVVVAAVGGFAYWRWKKKAKR